ncbi:MAG: ABC transporter ATP-binding protein [Pseudorhodobacter sp.]|nr:ABC transporter ATP-binding protein [Pseudorhodobacter sp.]
MPAPLTLTHASFAASGTGILHDISLTLTELRIGIIGRNGSGKTTLLRLIAGLIQPTSGTVRLNNTDPYTDRKATLAQLGILFQNPDHQILFPTVEEELAFGLRQQGHPDAARAVATLLATEQRSHWAKAATHTLSQGQRHYLCLLSVLLMKPGILLLDEPFAGLDLPTQTRLARRIAALPQQVITISHDPLAMAGADRVIWLDHGRIRADGPAAQVLAAFTTEMARLGSDDADTDLAR